MKIKIIPIVLFMVFAFISSVEAKSLEVLQAEYNAQAARNKAEVEAAVFQRIISKKGILFDAAEYYESGRIDKQYYLKKKEAEKRINQLRGQKKSGTSEYYQALEEFYTFQKMEYKELSANLEKNWYSGVSYWAVEGMKGSWNDAKSVAYEVWSKKWDLLKTLIDKGVGEAVKSLIYETIDATYKVRFVDYAMKNYGATKKIAEYWWDHFIMGNFKKSKTMELIEDVVGKGQEKVQEELEKNVKERVKDELIKKGSKLAKDELDKKAKEAAESFIRNLVTVPSILIECAAKYYNVIDFNRMFLDQAENHKNYLNNEIKRVLREIGKLNNDEINKCYFEPDYFMNLRKSVVRKNIPPKVTMNKKQGKDSGKIKIRVKSNLQTEIESAWEYSELEEKVDEQIKQTVQITPSKFDLQPFLDLINAAVDELRNDSIDYQAFKKKMGFITERLNEVLNSWANAVAIKEKTGLTEYLRKRQEEYKNKFVKARDSEIVKVDEDLKKYHMLIRKASVIDLEGVLKSLEKSLNAKVLAFCDEAKSRSIELAGNIYLAPTRDSAFTGPGGGPTKNASFKGLIENTGGVRRCFFYRAIEKPTGASGQFYKGRSTNGHIHNSVIIIMAGEWFSKSIYDIWHTGYNGTMQLEAEINEKRLALNELLNPEKEAWRVYTVDNNGNMVYQKEVASAINSFNSKSKSHSIDAMYREFLGYADFTRELLNKYENALEIALGTLEIYPLKAEANITSHRKILNWVNTEGKEIEDNNVKDWKLIAVSSVGLVDDLIAGKITPEEFEKKSNGLIEKQNRICAGQKYVKEMASIEQKLRQELKNCKTSIYFKIFPMYKVYLGKHTVNEKAVFEHLAIIPAQIEKELQGAIEFSRDRIDKLYRQEPRYYEKGLKIDLRKCNVAFKQREFYRLFIREIGDGYLENLKKLDSLYKKAINAQDKVNKWMKLKLVPLSEKVTAAKGEANIKEYQALSNELDQISRGSRMKYFELMKPDQSYVMWPLPTKENTAMENAIRDKLLILNHSLTKDGASAEPESLEAVLEDSGLSKKINEIKSDFSSVKSRVLAVGLGVNGNSAPAWNSDSTVLVVSIAKFKNQGLLAFDLKNNKAWPVVTEAPAFKNTSTKKADHPLILGDDVFYQMGVSTYNNQKCATYYPWMSVLIKGGKPVYSFEIRQGDVVLDVRKKNGKHEFLLLQKKNEKMGLFTITGDNPDPDKSREFACGKVKINARVTVSSDWKRWATADYWKPWIVYSFSGSKIATLPETFGGRGMAFSPDGRYVAGEYNDPKTNEVQMVVIPIDKVGKIHVLDKEANRYGACSWSPDGHYLAFSVFRTDGREELVIIDLVGGKNSFAEGKPFALTTFVSGAP